MNTPNKGQTPSRPQKLSSILTQEEDAAAGCEVRTVKWGGRRHRCPSTHPVPPSPGRGLRPGRLGLGKRLLPSRSTMSAPKSLPWRGEIKGRPVGGHPVERGRKEVDRVKEAFPSPLPVLLPLEKGLRTLAFVPDPAIKRLGPKPILGLSRCGFFRPPFWPVKKGTSRRVIPRESV
jgi:hypothetical protein